MVVAPVCLALARRARGRGDRQLDAWTALEQRLDQGALSDPRGAGDHQYGRVVDRGTYREDRYATISWRWRSESPPKVLLGEMRQLLSTLFALTRPYFGTAKSMS